MHKINLKNEIKIDLIQLLKVKSRVILILNYYYLKLMLAPHYFVRTERYFKCLSLPKDYYHSC